MYSRDPKELTEHLRWSGPDQISAPSILNGRAPIKYRAPILFQGPESSIDSRVHN